MVSRDDFSKNKFNLIAAGCGSGKTYWVINHLLKDFYDVKPQEIIFATSRTIIKDQQAQNAGTTKLRRRDTDIVDFWNGVDDDITALSHYGISLLTYDHLIELIMAGDKDESEVLRNVKIIIMDECHTLFSDTFIENVDALNIWTRETIYKGGKIFIGLSATTTIVELYGHNIGLPINRINKDAVIGYQAKQLITTNFDTVPYLISANKLQGKTIIMCPSIKHCYELAGKINNSTVVVSHHSKSFTDEMKRIRDHIVRKEMLPEIYYDEKGNEHELHVLICTSTLREGFNLKKESGVRNVVSCVTDELHVTQLAGRCRYNLDTIVIADTFLQKDNKTPYDYLVKSRKSFKRYLENKENITWFNTISHLVVHDAYGTKKFILGTEDVRFSDYINKRWLVPKGTTGDEIKPYRIYKQEDKDEITQMSINCKMFALFPSQITFMRVVRLLRDSFGYAVDDGDAIIDGNHQRYKIIIGQDESKSSYEPAILTIDE